MVQAAIALAAMRAAVTVLPFRVTARLLGLEQIGARTTDRRRDARAAEIGWALRATAAHTPWNNTCLVQALAGAAMLRQRRIPATLTLGVARESATEHLIAHAWLRCGEEVLTGDAARDRFVELASFGIG